VINWVENEVGRQTGLSLTALLEPISEEAPAGADLARSELYGRIRAARAADDASLPMGEWRHDLKLADWEKVVRLSATGIAEQSKDLQLCAWLVEGLLHCHGFAGIAAGVHILGALCEEYWTTMHPAAEDGNVDRRVNLFDWMNRKLQSPASLIPLTVPASNDAPVVTWSDRLLAQRYERVRVSERGKGEPEGPTIDGCRRAVALTPTQELQWSWEALECARESFQALKGILKTVSPEAPPSALPALAELLAQIQAFFASELYARGVNVNVLIPKRGTEEAGSPPLTDAAESEEGLPGKVASFTVAEEPFSSPSKDLEGMLISSRNEAYEALSGIAEFLERIEPHSPTPSLLRRAVEWGRLSSGELYRHIFLECKGNLNIFELMGIEPNGPGRGQ
jgi:type VI secretion system protein ImpA